MDGVKRSERRERRESERRERREGELRANGAERAECTELEILAIDCNLV